MACRLGTPTPTPTHPLGLSVCLQAYVGASYDLQQKTFSPVGAITYELGAGVVAELTDSKALLSKRWVLGDDDRFAMHLKAECRLQLRELVRRGWGDTDPSPATHSCLMPLPLITTQPPPHEKCAHTLSLTYHVYLYNTVNI